MSVTKAKWAERAARYDAWADAAEAKARAIYAARPEHASDIAFITQPARSSARVARARQRINEREQRAWALEQKAAEYRAKAANLRAMASRNAGDAAREQEEKREALSAVLSVGDTVRTLYGDRRVTKINGKSLRVEGVSSAIPLHLCRRVAA